MFSPSVSRSSPSSPSSPSRSRQPSPTSADIATRRFKSTFTGELRNSADVRAWRTSFSENRLATVNAIKAGVREELASVRTTRSRTGALMTERDVGAAITLWDRVVGHDDPTVRPGRPAYQEANPPLAFDASDASPRDHVTLIQYCAELSAATWLATGVQCANAEATKAGAASKQEAPRYPVTASPAERYVTAVFHTPSQPTPFRIRPGEEVPACLVSPTAERPELVKESIARRVESVRWLARGGASVFLCYPDDECHGLPVEQRKAFTLVSGECDGRGNVVRFRGPASREAYTALSGATYFFGSRPGHYDACLSFRLVQASKIEASLAASNISIDWATADTPLYQARVNELRVQLGFDIETCVDAANRARAREDAGPVVRLNRLVDESRQRRSPPEYASVTRLPAIAALTHRRP